MIHLYRSSWRTGMSVLAAVILYLRLCLSGDVELNPGPRNSDLLQMKDLRTVRAKLWEARNKWFNIGLELGLTYTALVEIREGNRGDPSECFTHLLAQWLQSSDPPATWSSILEALRSPIINLGELANSTVEDLRRECNTFRLNENCKSITQADAQAELKLLQIELAENKRIQDELERKRRELLRRYELQPEDTSVLNSLHTLQGRTDDMSIHHTSPEIERYATNVIRRRTRRRNFSCCRLRNYLCCCKSETESTHKDEATDADNGVKVSVPSHPTTGIIGNKQTFVESQRVGDPQVQSNVDLTVCLPPTSGYPMHRSASLAQTSRTSRLSLRSGSSQMPSDIDVKFSISGPGYPEQRQAGMHHGASAPSIRSTSSQVKI